MAPAIPYPGLADMRRERLRGTPWRLYPAASGIARIAQTPRMDASPLGNGQNGGAMAETSGDSAGQGLEAVLLANRPALLRFLAAHGAGDAAEDLLQELWLRLSERAVGPVGNPLSYLYRAANNLMIDRHRAERQARLRDKCWTETHGGEEAAPDPSAEDALISREELQRMNAALDALGERPAHCLRRFRLDGVAQKDIAMELGVSLSTVESDLRRAYAALLAARRQSDDA